MRYHLLIAAPNGPLPCGPREADELPAIGSTITETIDERQLHLEVFGYQQLPMIPSGVFKHDEVWVICRLV